MFDLTPTSILLSASIIFGTVAAGVVILGDEAERSPLDQIWISHLPKDERDISVLVVGIEAQNLGLLSSASQWRNYQDLYRWTWQNQIWRWKFPQTGLEVAFQTKVWECDTNPPFELCMDLVQGKRVFHFFSFKEWSIDSIAEAQAFPQIQSTVPCEHGEGYHEEFNFFGW